MKVFNKVDFEEWQEAADECKYATFFHTPVWSKIFVETYPKMEMSAKKFIFNGGTKVILPLVKRKTRKGFYNLYYSGIAGVYGGVISSARVEEGKLDCIFKYLSRKKTSRFMIIGNPFFYYDLNKFKNTGKFFTQILELDKDEDKLLKSYKSSARNKINKARRAGIVIKEAENINEWREYYSVYRKSIERWGNEATNSYPFFLFENMFKAKNPGIRLWLVFFRNKIVRGSLNFYHNDHCVEWHASFISDYFKYGVRNFLVHSLILAAREEGYKYYDFNPSGDHSGTVKFKESFNPRVAHVNIWEIDNSFFKKAADIKSKIINGLEL